MTLKILLLCDKPKKDTNANTIFDHISAFEKYSRHQLTTCSNVGDLPPHIDLNQFQVVIVHYSVNLLWDYYLSPSAKECLKHFKGLKVMFVQDEYRQIDKMVAEIDYVNFDLLFTCFPESEIENIYPKYKLPNLVKYNNLTGYLPEQLISLKSHTKTSERPIDVGYRGRQIPFWLGQLAYDKTAIVDGWYQHTKNSDLNVNISYHEKDRIYGDQWIEFISSCKTTLGVESGASVMDFTGKLEKRIDEYMRSFPDASFYEVQKLFLESYESKFKLNQISPRCFEAISLKTVLVLFEGEYSGILIPDRHYIPLKKDFSNIEKVVSSIKDTDFLQEMANRTYDEIALNSNYTYKTFVQNVETKIETEFKLRNKEQILATSYEEKTRLPLKPAKVEQFYEMSFKHFITRKVRIFNPFLKVVKRSLIKLIQS